MATSKPKMIFTSLAHLIDIPFLREAWKRTRKDSSPGIDDMTAAEYAVNLDANLLNLHQRLKIGTYTAPSVKRVWIPKDDGRKRPIGMPTFEDKIVQRAVNMLMGAVYERDFYSCSYGFREGRSQHQALHEIREQCHNLKIRWVIDADVSGYFDNISHGKLQEIIRRRINDGGLLRLVGKWLHAGVMDGGILTYPDKGTPQGGVVSPLLANIFLHTILDEWFLKAVQPRMEGRCFLVRFADDFVIGFELENDARRVMEVLPKRFEKFGLTIHPEKTRLIAFRPPAQRSGERKGEGTFNFLGFTHMWAKSQRGFWVIKRKTMRKRLQKAKSAIWVWCRRNRHEPLAEQHKTLVQKLRGHYQYYSLRSNSTSVTNYWWYTRRSWRYWLSRRSTKSNINWKKYLKMLETYPLPRPRIIHQI
jgi:group II intron reverse transcriptase/maturase